MPPQGASRIDSPSRYRVLYFAEDPAIAVGEAFASRPVWMEEMFEFPVLPDARSSLITVQVDARVVDLDDAAALAERALRPSIVATPDRTVTQAWAARIFAEKRWAGIRWWSARDARWGVVGLWSLESIRIQRVEPLARDHDAVRRATALLKKRWAKKST
ncbi:MAG TPA: RES family NAD+ phosphorylase [Actinomycetota bacterium]|nr:RES family NAD+ phosphorylase [Actinomycetota bacterium]